MTQKNGLLVKAMAVKTDKSRSKPDKAGGLDFTKESRSLPTLSYKTVDSI